MGDLAATLRERVAEVERSLRRARLEGDAHGEDAFAAELEDLERTAAAHGIAVRALGEQEPGAC